MNSQSAGGHHTSIKLRYCEHGLLMINCPKCMKKGRKESAPKPVSFLTRQQMKELKEDFSSTFGDDINTNNKGRLPDEYR